jgi:hypothetical protein
MIDYSISSKILQKELEFLKTFSFDRLKVKKESSKLAGESLLLSYESTKTGRRIEISYLYAQQGRPYSIVVFIYEKNGESFSLEDWLNSKGKNEKIKLVSDMDSNKFENNFLSTFAKSFERLCMGDLKDIVSGDFWESVPFDWKGYR